ncbi:Protein transport protein sec73 [Grifola frondosa]|uniref:Protein transport protein sec73 n=1 Tax=Grifola frondosa TaxID=5627 RepID=A0A1C7MSH6_GRIFR|nr:Protein transport protein sec73 [Grifola frondosa]
MSLAALKESSQTQPSHAPLASQTSRPRAQTNPPLLHRLSVNIFGSSSNSPSSTSAPNIAGESAIGSPPSSLGSSRPSLSKPSVEIPRPRTEDESPEVYLTRLMEAVSKAEVATVLAANSDEFHARALRAYIERFEFTGNPLDVAVRKLLMDVGLPRETQQIDRVVEAFAARYTQCNPNLFTSDDHPYILAFSLIMLHTDAFNKSNKRKMSKLDYVKNTRLPGVAPEVLDCFYDNIVFAPFIFIEDPVDVNGQRGLIPEAISRRMSTLNMSSPGGLNGTGSTLLGKSNRIDPYYLITQNLLDDLRVNVDAFVPPQSPFFYQGTGGPWVEEELLRAFAMARVVEVAAVENRYLTSPWFGLNVTGPPSSMFQNSFGAVPAVSAPGGDMWSIKVTKVGLLLRKDDTLEGGRRAINRKWREWSVLLTGSQLLFFRDSSWAPSIQAQMDPSSGQVILPHTSMSQPDELLSVRDAIAVFDSSYSKVRTALRTKLYTQLTSAVVSHAFRLVMPDGRHYLVQAPDEKEMNEWISRINYASAFKTAGVRMRGMGLSGKDIELTGIAAAASHLRDLQHSAQISAAPKIRTWNGRSSEDLDMSSRGEMSPTRECSSVKEASAHSATDDAPTPPFENTSLLFKATFDQVKTELASGRWRSLDETGPWTGRKRAYSWESTLISPPTSPKSDNSEASRLSSRSQIIKSKVHDLESKIALAQTQLDADMRFVRNLAVLTPFQRATRDRMQLAVQGVAKRIMHIRLDLEKLVCYRDVLANDLAAEERDWQRTKTIALRAATEKLESQRAAAEVPRMTLSLYLDESEPAQVSAPLSIPSRSANTSGYSSNGESFHSAQSGSMDWDPARRSSALVVSSPLMFESPMASPTDGGGSVTSTGSFPFPETAERPQASSPARERSMETSEGGGHEKFYTAAEMSEEQAEQAEEWNKTRAAKRVSLVKLPSDLRISMLFGKPVQTREEGEGELESDPAPPRRRGSLNPYDGPGATVMMLDV